MEFVARAGKTPEPHTLETMVNLQVGKAHLTALARVARFDKGFRPHEPSRNVTGFFMDSAGDLSRRHVGTALHLKRTDIAVELGGGIAKHGAFVDGAGGVQNLVTR